MATATPHGSSYPNRPARRAGSALWAAVLIAAGLAAVALPVLAGFGMLGVAAAVLLLGGAAHAVYSLTTRRIRAFAWHAGIGLLYVGAGVYMLVNPAVGLASLALLMAVLFVLEGGLLIGGWWAMRGLPRTGWLLANGIVAAALGLVIIAAWPEASGEMLGLLLGVNLIFAGFSRLMHRPSVSPMA